ncbi:MAG: histidine kinase dimerization/phospho-acceptor domain-containing protein [Caulobacteraceae bacterium]
MVSHELRTPLNSIIGFSEVISKELCGPLGSPQYKEIRRARAPERAEAAASGQPGAGDRQARRPRHRSRPDAGAARPRRRRHARRAARGDQLPAHSGRRGRRGASARRGRRPARASHRADQPPAKRRHLLARGRRGAAQRPSRARLRADTDRG